MAVVNQLQHSSIVTEKYNMNSSIYRLSKHNLMKAKFYNPALCMSHIYWGQDTNTGLISMSYATLVCMPCTKRPFKTQSVVVYAPNWKSGKFFHSCIIKEKSFIKFKYSAVGPITMLSNFWITHNPALVHMGHYWPQKKWETSKNVNVWEWWWGNSPFVATVFNK